MKRVSCWLLLTFIVFSTYAQKTYEVTWTDYGNGMLPKQRTSFAYKQIYNADNLLAEQRYPPQEGVERSIFFRYNDKKQLVSEEEFPLDRWKPVKKYNYDLSGLPRDASWNQRNKEEDSVYHYESYQYDADGRLINKELQRTVRGRAYGSESWKYTYEVTGGNKKVTETYFVDGKKKNKKKYTLYNDKGLIVLKRDGSYYTKYTYEYDKTGDWVVQKMCVKDSNIGMWRCEGELHRVLVNP